MNVTFAPMIIWPLLLLFAVSVAGLIAYSLYKGLRGALLRLAVGTLLVLALANPVIHLDETEKLSDIAVLVIDRTASQSIGNRQQQTDGAAAALQKILSTMQNTELRITTVTSDALGTAGGTRAFAALARAVSDIPQSRYAGAIMLTDGQVHDAPKPNELAALHGPLHAIITGSKTDSDRRLVIDHAPEFTLVGKSAKIGFHVEDQGGDGADVPLTIEQAGQEALHLTVKPGASAEVEVPISHAGKNYVALKAAVRAGELTPSNNISIATIEGIRDRLRVLLVSGQPNAGERTWRNLLKADTAVDLIHFTILRPPEKQDGTPLNELSLIAFPTKELFVDKLDQFDLVIFDRYQREVILPDEYIANIADYVRRGGALLVASGPDYAQADGLASSPMADILPALPTGDITETPFKPKLSEVGERHPVTQSLKGGSRTEPAWGKWFRLIDATVSPDASTQVLLEGPNGKPLLVLRHVELGRVAQILSDQGWLWARGFDGGGPEADLQKRMAHWLMKEPELEEDRLTAHQSGTDIIVDRFGLRDDYASLDAVSPSGTPTKLSLSKIGPGHFQGHLHPQEQGLYVLRDGTLETIVTTGSGDMQEFSDLVATTKKVEPATKATGGGVFWAEEGLPSISKQSANAAFAGAGWLNLHANNQFRTIAVHEWALSSSLFALAALLLAAGLMWRREGR